MSEAPATVEGQQPTGGPLLLVVCTGNICRSPMAERLLKAAFDAAEPDPALRVRVASAGTSALTGAPMEPEAADAVRRAGGDPTGHEATYLTSTLIREAALVLTAARDHRGAVVRLVPAAVRRTFTLPEAARLLEAVGDQVQGDRVAERLVSAASILAGARGRVMPKEPGDDDVLDPYRRGPKEWATSEEQVTQAVRAIVGALVPSGRALTTR
ncbi:protein-tyrosine phosphatase [Quadrisphaera granulorum]|uniref:Protein-tyrosine phosphatase n=1 Tax=Quadrisphaera granulorum TaxID=317664 RepID=A0A316AE48_9ACTN|nr:hypothetical protein [Quadrisphaera granulorum]PWJ56055.1 protein-tyrosine phosphatase [Quadrisphaera granulorum]SZE94689.1 protein-tyrosine phosphatase [Quadrisphaera granulorum]